MIIKLNQNNGFMWKSSNKINFKGYTYYKDEYLNFDEIISMLEGIKEFEEFNLTVQELNGNFAIVIDRDNYVWAATDKARSFPLYYSEDGEIISDDVNEIIRLLKLDEKDYDDVSISELVLSSFIHGNNTAYKKVKQLDLGQTLEFNESINVKYYYRHLHTTLNKDKEVLVKEFQDMSEKVFNRLINSLNNKTVILPLSGRYDSRYIAAMLKKKNYNNVICYTYGTEDSYEVRYSREVASKLGFTWFFVEYSAEKWYGLIDEDFKDYCCYSYNHSAIPHIQDFIALKELKEKGLIPNDGIVVTGFCGDLPAGSFVLPDEDKESITLNVNWISSYIYDENYVHLNGTKSHERLIQQRIKKYINNLNVPINTFEDFMNMYEVWFTGARPSKWVVNSNRLYEYFGFEWRMPLWDHEFLNFWYRVDNRERLNSKLYIEVLFKWLFEDYRIDYYKPKNIRLHTVQYKKSLKYKIKLNVVGLLNFLYIKTGIDLLKSRDINNYRIVAYMLQKKIKSRRLINYKKMSAHQMMALWWVEQIYGAKYIKSIFERSLEE